MLELCGLLSSLIQTRLLSVICEFTNWKKFLAAWSEKKVMLGETIHSWRRGGSFWQSGRELVYGFASLVISRSLLSDNIPLSVFLLRSPSLL